MAIQLPSRHALWLAAALSLGACTTAETEPPAPPAQRDATMQDFHRHGFLDSDVAAIAAYVAGDLPKSPGLSADGGAAVVALPERNVRALDEQVVLDRRAFARQLVAELQRQPGNAVIYVGAGAPAQAGGSRGESRGGSQRGSRGSGAGASSGSSPSAGYVMEVAVGRSQPPDAGYPNAQRYVITVKESASGRAVWEGAFLIDAPAQPADNRQAQ